MHNDTPDSHVCLSAYTHSPLTSYFTVHSVPRTLWENISVHAQRTCSEWMCRYLPVRMCVTGGSVYVCLCQVSVCVCACVCLAHGCVCQQNYNESAKVTQFECEMEGPLLMRNIQLRVCWMQRIQVITCLLAVESYFHRTSADKTSHRCVVYCTVDSSHSY